ncbi:MAG: hypothetical protein ACYDAR_01595 [Thermomicrobiales bacterium]
MRLRRMIAALAGTLALLAFATPALAAPSVTVPTSVTYGDNSALKATGLNPGAAYLILIYGPLGLPIATIPSTAGADGSFTRNIPPPPQAPPGQYTFFIVTPDYVTVAKTTGLLTGISPYFFIHQLGV